MRIYLKQQRCIEVIFGIYDDDMISLKNLVKVYLDDCDMYWRGFLPLNPESKKLYLTDKYTLLSHVTVSMKDSYDIAQYLLQHVDCLLEGHVKNPASKEQQSAQKFVSIFDAQQKAVIAAMLYRIKLYGGYSGVIGSRPYLSMEEMIFLEECLVLSPYLKQFEADISIEQFMVAIRYAYRQILNRRMKFESLMDLNATALAYVYDDLPISTIKQ